MSEEGTPLRQTSEVATTLPPTVVKASGGGAAEKNAGERTVAGPSSALSGSFHNRTSREEGGRSPHSRKRAREEEDTSLPGGRGGDSQEEGGSKDGGTSERTVPQQPGGQVATVGETSSSDVLSVHHPHAIIANPVQKKNPVMRHIRNVPWELGDIVPDFVLGRTTCAMFLSVRYHSLHPNYIHSRLKQLGKQYQLRVLLVLVDMKECQKTLQELAKIAILADLTLILAWSYEEAGRYLETYKAFENKPPDMLMERVDSDFSSRVTESLTTVKKVNKTDAATLLSTFKTMEKVVTASREELMLCPGLGPQKAQRLFSVFHEPFKKPRLDPQE